jgi:integrase
LISKWHNSGTLKKRHGAMATIRERTNPSGNPVYHVQIRLKGYSPQTASFRRLTDARRWAQRTEADMRDGRYFSDTAAKRHTIADLIDRYRKTIVPQKRPNTIAAQRSHLNWWDERVGHMRLADMTPAVIVEHRDLLRQTFGPATTNRYLSTLSHAFTVALREWEWLDDTPFRRVSKQQEPRGRVRFLSDSERQCLLDACHQSDHPHLYIIVVSALSTGARKMEILTLRWDNVDLQRGMITLHDTKNKERRSLPLAGLALQLVRDHARVRRIDTDLVFPREDGLAPVDIRKAWETARSKAEIADFRFHDLRHSAASYLAMNGASLAEIAEVLGHKTLAMVKRYAHLSEQHTAGVVARMNSAIFGDL